MYGPIEASDGSTQDIEADLVFINTGTRAVVPKVDGLERVPYLTNSTILELTEVPEHLVIVGASYIALEFGQMFRRFGSRVTLLVRGERILTREDEDVARAMQDVLVREGVVFRFGTQIERVEPSSGGMRDELGAAIASGAQRQPGSGPRVVVRCFHGLRSMVKIDLWASTKARRD